MTQDIADALRELVDTLFGCVPLYRRLRGGRRERVCEVLVIGTTFWTRVDLPTPSRGTGRMGEAIIAREDWRR